MADQQTPEITEADVQSLAQKLAQFNKTLTPGEFAALAAVVVSGMPQAEDVQGFVKPGNENAPNDASPSLLQPIFQPYIAKKAF